MEKNRISEFLESIDSEKWNCVYQANGMTLLTTKEYNYRYEDTVNLQTQLKKLQQENKQLKDNWNKLKEDLINDINYWHEQEKEWIKLGFINFGGEANTKIIFKKVLDKMQELERG